MLYKIKNTASRLSQICQNIHMHKFIFKCFLLLLPFAIGLGYVEHRLSLMAVSYSQKKHEIESQLDQIQVLVLGSSNGYYGINPHFFSMKGFNLSYRGQWPYYDLKFVEKYLDRMPNLKMVIFSANYFTLGTQPLEAAEDWRIYFYAQYHHILPPTKIGAFLGLHHPLDPKLFSKIALFGERTKEYLLHGTMLVDGGEPGEDMTGWFDSGTKPCDLALNIGPSGAAAHNGSVNPVNFQLNLDLVTNIVTRLKVKNIRFALIELPELSYYTDNLDPAKAALMEEKIKNFSKINQVAFYSYLNDKRFGLEDFTDMPDHLNTTGAEKISKIINQDIIEPVVKSNN